MTADMLFNIANPTAIIGWLVLGLGAITKREFFFRTLAGTVWPIALSALYTALIIFFFFKAQGGFDSLAHVQQLFTSPWAALAGWVHYLAFDLFVGAWITGQVLERGLPRLLLTILLPLTFLFGPIGFAAFWLSKIAFDVRGEKT